MLLEDICPAVIPEVLSGFSSDRGTIDLIFSAYWQIQKKCLEKMYLSSFHWSNEGFSWSIMKHFHNSRENQLPSNFLSTWLNSCTKIWRHMFHSRNKNLTNFQLIMMFSALFWPRLFSRSTLLLYCLMLFTIVTKDSYCSLEPLIEFLIWENFRQVLQHYNSWSGNLFDDFVTNSEADMPHGPVRNLIPKSAYQWFKLCSLQFQSKNILN